MIMKKKIAFVMYDGTVGGTERVLLNMLSDFDFDRYDVTLWLMKEDGPMFKNIDSRIHLRFADTVDGWDCIKHDIRNRNFSHMIKGIFARTYLKKDWLHEKWYLNEIYPTVDEKYDCVVAYMGISATVASFALNRLIGKKKILWVHGIFNFTKIECCFLNNQYKKFDLVYCVSKDARDDFIKKFPKSRNKVYLYYNHIDTGRIINMTQCDMDTSMRHTSIVTVARLSEEKGQNMVPRITRMLLDQGYMIHWYLIGEGALREVVEAEIEKHNVGGFVHLLGTKENPYPYIKNCDIYVQPSFREGYCTTTVEAKILQKPIVTTDAPGMREQFVSGENGLIVDAMTPEALFDGIKTLIDHPEMREKFVENLKNEGYDNTKELQKLYDFIES